MARSDRPEPSPGRSLADSGLIQVWGPLARALPGERGSISPVERRHEYCQIRCGPVQPTNLRPADGPLPLLP